MADLSRRELVILAPMVALMIWIGVQPGPFLRRMEPSVQVVLEQVNGGGSALAAETSGDAEASITFKSANPLDEEEPEDPAPIRSGDEE
jgi:NADH-quinone oxidoreductase subunit M